MSRKNLAFIQIWDQVIQQKINKSTFKEYSPFLRPYFWWKSRETPHITTHLINSVTPKPAVLIVPGGAYMTRARHEGLPVAQWLNSIGFSAFILNYRHGPFRQPIPLLDAQRAMRYIRHHAKRFNILPNAVGILGFSAGGHLAASLSTIGNRDWFPEDYISDEIDALSAVPNASILCYPLISMRNKAHNWSRLNLLGKHATSDVVSQWSPENHVSPSTPPTFLWTTKTDLVVPYEHTLWYQDALKSHNVPHEVHVFNGGQHGLGLALQHEDVSKWTSLCAAWLSQHLK